MEMTQGPLLQSGYRTEEIIPEVLPAFLIAYLYEVIYQVELAVCVPVYGYCSHRETARCRLPAILMQVLKAIRMM